MSIQRVANGMTFILLLSCVSLVLLIFLQWTTSTRDGYQLDTKEITTAIEKIDTTIFKGINNTTVQLKQFSEILARPLFREGRIPYEEEKPELVIDRLAAAPKLKLEGVVISPVSRLAVVRDQTNNELLRLPVGAIYNGWKLSSVEPDAVTLTSGEKIHELQLELVKKPIVKSKRSGFRLPSSKKK